jgi:FkbM family methyltransferase
MGFSLKRYLLSKLSYAQVGVTPQEWKRLRFTYAQHGEDIIAEALLPEEYGFYVEIGAFHPVSISNTYLFYRKGWRGIVVDPAPAVAALFKKRRPEDIMLAYAVSPEENVKKFGLMNGAESNGLIGANETAGSGTPKQVIEVKCLRLETILNKYLPPQQKIDFLSVDTEGHDFHVLTSNNWEKYRPRLVAVEDFQTLEESEICKFMGSKGYRLILSAKITRFFME